ncbi:hypothetical protein GOODEAATRI_002875 [Goodea atripinnis]|uniref:Uncharacterized protein n=1 Tax=Goodea atripinnis TaxID=208336 RepID=A0ABV0NH04_9TELE
MLRLKYAFPLKCNPLEERKFGEGSKERTLTLKRVRYLSAGHPFFGGKVQFSSIRCICSTKIQQMLTQGPLEDTLIPSFTGPNSVQIRKIHANKVSLSHPEPITCEPF